MLIALADQKKEKEKLNSIINELIMLIKVLRDDDPDLVVTKENLFMRELEFDSIKVFRLVDMIENKFGINYPLMSLPYIYTVENMARVIMKTKHG